MGKKRTKYEASQEDHEELAYLLTRLVAIINPNTDRMTVYELMYEMLGEGMCEETIDTYGAWMRSTSTGVSPEVH